MARFLVIFIFTPAEIRARSVAASAPLNDEIKSRRSDKRGVDRTLWLKLVHPNGLVAQSIGGGGGIGGFAGAGALSLNGAAVALGFGGKGGGGGSGSTVSITNMGNAVLACCGGASMFLPCTWVTCAMSQIFSAGGPA